KEQFSQTSLEESVKVGGCGKCLTHWIFYNSSCYFFSYLESHKVKKNWPDSRADCVSRGKFVSHTIENMKTSPNFWENGFWVGLTDSKAEGTWVWINNLMAKTVLTDTFNTRYFTFFNGRVSE
uniref:C-type lectin domain-containing protein n=1 Tax=Mastacembelus armatus TaxID=205130 RepID=A0A7N8WZH1_9TELE